jgi:hypothetical protein
MRSLHSHNRRVVIEINKLIGKIAHLHRPDNRTHEKHLTKMIAQTWRAAELIISRGSGRALISWESRFAFSENQEADRWNGPA